MQLFDTHCHIGLIYDNPIEQFRVILQAKQVGVTRIVSINNNLIDFKKEYNILKSQKGIYHAVGVGPSEVNTPGDNWVKTIEESVQLPNVVAIGETGLDYGKKYGDKRRQIELFMKQLELANKYDLPAIIHNRNAGEDIFEVLKTRMPKKGIVFHCYSEDAAFAQKCLDAGLDCYFSFAGNLTYPNARNLHGTVLSVPVERILLETESPFIPPHEYYTKGIKRTMPSFLPSTLRFLAGMLQMDEEALAAQLWKNSCKIFNLPEE